MPRPYLGAITTRVSRIRKRRLKQQSLLDSKKTEGASLSRDISILQTKIKKTETEIKARDKAIQNINYNITDKNKRLMF